jgi:hypothetical protein
MNNIPVRLKQKYCNAGTCTRSDASVSWRRSGENICVLVYVVLFQIAVQVPNVTQDTPWCTFALCITNPS